MSFIYTKANNQKELRDICHFFPNDLKVPFFNGALTPESYINKWGKTHTVIGFNTDTGKFSAYTPKDVVLRKLRSLKFNSFAHIVKENYHPYVKGAPVFHVGFELEGFIHNDFYDNLIHYVDDLYHGSFQIPEDNSIKNGPIGFTSIEIATPPLPIEQAAASLEWLLGMLSILTQEGLFSTNNTCGFHVNLSEVNCFKAPDEELRKHFAFNLMQCFDAQRWRRSFRRQRNKYCWWNGAPKRVEEVHREKESMIIAQQHGIGIERARHWAAINTQHLDAPVAQNRRIEIRIAGGTNYHSRSECLCNYLLDIQSAIEQAHERL